MIETVKNVIPEIRHIPPTDLFRSREFHDLLHVLHTDRLASGNLICSHAVMYLSPRPDRWSEFVEGTSNDTPILSPAIASDGNPSFTQAELVATSTHLARSVNFGIAERILFATSNADTVALALQIAALQSGSTLVYSPHFADSMAEAATHHCTTLAASFSTLAALDLNADAMKRVNKAIIVGHAGAKPSAEVTKAIADLESRGITVFLIQ